MFSYLIQLIWFWNFLQCCRWHSPTVGSRMPDLLLLNMPIVCSHICYDIVASSGRIRIWLHPSAIVYPVQSPVLCLHSPLSTLHLTQSQPDCGLICAVHSSMPDKSMCQHLFLCCQFFMVFDDISPIVRPTCVVRWDPCPSPCLPSAGHKHQTVSDQFWGACLPIWLNRTWTLRGELCRWQDAFFSLFFSLPLAWAF